MNDHHRITTFDTTLGDGKRSPGGAPEPAQRLERPGVDVVEAGLASSSPGDLGGVRAAGTACTPFTAPAETRRAVSLYDVFEEVAAA